ncbi:MAG: hypothetical protein ACYS67_20355 [Planctomycetota bacterium]|jgi:hypothetical protein
MMNKLLLVLLILRIIPVYCQELVGNNAHQLILSNSNPVVKSQFIRNNNLSDFTYKAKKASNGNLIWLTDFSMNSRLNSVQPVVTTFPDSGEISKDNYRGRLYLVSELGVLKKINPKTGFGISHFLGIDITGDDNMGIRNGIKLKYRQWLNNDSFFDISPGITLFDNPYKSPGFVGSIDWWKNESFALSLLVEYLPKPKNKVEYYDDEIDGDHIWRTTEYEQDLGFYIGIRTGSKTGFIANGVFYGLAAISIALISFMG